ncbi:response regulator FixJ [Botrimarina colliarenosi]|uniref:Response regulator FixJ n=1 Tax=Botrimarina colliarenosi TaxID=2528001 RepID=A0A5C6AKF1_9BACT|nr:LuxR C-terminal-related transcriptional regulator [Botrimarina colliarenosi]TWU00525.1 response regulator FixJ [Botrimarina colliarenosi]
MQAFYNSIDQQCERLGGACRAILVGANDTSYSVWRTAAESQGVFLQTVSEPSEADSLLRSDSVTFIISPIRWFTDAASMNWACRWLHQLPIVVIGGNAIEASLWRQLAWDAVAPEELSRAAETVVEMARDEAFRRARQRRVEALYYERIAAFSPEEAQVFTAVCSGRLNKQIASDLKVSVRTIEQRRRRVFEKMGVDSAVPLSALAATVQTLAEQNRVCQRVAIQLAPASIPEPKTFPRITSPDVSKRPVYSM